MCKGQVQDGFSSFTADMGNCIVVIKNVPSLICEQCGETTYNTEVSLQLEKIVKNITTSVCSEITVVNYSERAA
jgi:YgiT-type zinc finger domain-containing protein